MSFVYKRENHFLDCIHALQGKIRRSRMTVDDLEQCKNYCQSEINPNKVREWMRENRKRISLGCYEEKYYVAGLLGWVNPLANPLIFSDNDVSDLVSDFRKINSVYREACQKVNPLRTSFINFYFIIGQLLKRKYCKAEEEESLQNVCCDRILKFHNNNLFHDESVPYFLRFLLMKRYRETSMRNYITNYLDVTPKYSPLKYLIYFTLWDEIERILGWT